LGKTISTNCSNGFGKSGPANGGSTRKLQTYTPNAGSISAEIAKELATKEFEKFRVIQDEDYESDFDKEVKRIKGE